MAGMNKLLLNVFLGVCLIGCATRTAGKYVSTVKELRCEYLKDPLGVDVPRPRLSWITEAKERGWRQGAYQVLVASSKEQLEQNRGDLWDSGKVESDQSLQVGYSGKPLESRMACYWKVRVWSLTSGLRSPAPSSWSEPAKWTMGLLKPDDWRAKWIRPGISVDNVGGPQALGVLANPPHHPRQSQHPWLRRTFELRSEIKHAKVYVNTPCLYELSINGRKVGDDVLMPAYVPIQKRAFYNVYDVAPLLQKGKNCIALWMGLGWYQHNNRYGAPIVRAQLEVETQDGSTVIATDGEWRTAESCISQIGRWKWNNFGGERYDAGLYLDGWNLAAFDDRVWAKAVEITPPNLTTSWQALPGNKTDPPIPAKSITPFKGKWLIDFGTTLTGWMRLQMSGLKPGQQVVLDYADMLDPNLMFSKNEDGVQTHNQRDIFVAGNKPAGVFQSTFNQHAFRYVLVRGLDKAPDLSDAQAMMVRTHLEPTGAFRCSNELFNRIHAITVQTCLTQAPAGALGGGEPREKEAYGDGGSFLTGWVYNFGSDAFFMKWLQDWRDNQREDGFFGNTAPSVSIHGGGPSWGGQASELMRRLILYYGDRTLAGEYYPALKKYVDYLESHTENDILRRFNPKTPQNPKSPNQWQFLGDWTPPGASAEKHKFEFESTDQQEFFNNCYRILLWQDLADFAGVTGDAAERKRCEDRLTVLRPLIHKTYFDPAKNNYRVNRQAYLVIALRARIMPEELRPVIFKHLEDDIVVTKKGHLDVGMQGSFMLLDLLVKENRPDLAALIMGQETYPGWGFLVKERKVTTWPETWSGWGSQIIQVVGTAGSWFYEGLAGIRPDPEHPGFKHFTLRPAMVKSVDRVECSYNSPYGRIVSNWKRAGDKLTMDVMIPANTTATVYVPAKEASTVTESGKPASQAEGVNFLRMEDGVSVYEVGSGDYQFCSEM